MRNATIIEQPDETVPDNALVPCPIRAGLVVSVRPTCLGCEHHAGLLVLNNDPTIPWSARHQVRCGVPRRISLTEKADG